jgi:hypothetical protein
MIRRGPSSTRSRRGRRRGWHCEWPSRRMPAQPNCLLPDSGRPIPPARSAPPAASIGGSTWTRSKPPLNGVADIPLGETAEKGALCLLRSEQWLPLVRRPPLWDARCRPYPPFLESGVHSGESIHDASFIRSATRDSTRAYDPSRESQAYRSQTVASLLRACSPTATPAPSPSTQTHRSKPCPTTPRSVRSR